jgi:hypothetical protein
MSLSPSSGGPPSRRSREQRAYRLVKVGGVAAVVAVVGLVLSILGVVGSGLWIAAAVVAVVCAILFRSTVKR